MRVPKLIFLPISPLIILIAGLAFVAFPAIFFLAEWEAMSQQSAISYPQFGLTNHLVMFGVEVAGLIMLLSTFVSRSHWLFSTIIAVFSICCGLIAIEVSLAYFLVTFSR
jgi:hypothetical protein